MTGRESKVALGAPLSSHINPIRRPHSVGAKQDDVSAWGADASLRAVGDARHQATFVTVQALETMRDHSIVRRHTEEARLMDPRSAVNRWHRWTGSQ